MATSNWQFTTVPDSIPPEVIVVWEIHPLEQMFR